MSRVAALPFNSTTAVIVFELKNDGLYRCQNQLFHVVF